MLRILALGLLLFPLLAGCGKEGGASEATAQSSAASSVENAGAAAEAPPQDLFAFAAGAQVVSGGLGEVDYGVNFGPYNLIDESASTDWMVEAGAPASVILELAERTSLTRFAFDTDGLNKDEKAVKGIRVEVSDASATSGFSPVLEAELKMAESGQSFALPSPAVGRWVKITALSNYGSDYYGMIAVHGYGDQLTHDAKITDITGSYLGENGWGLVQLKQEGTRVAGCYEYLQGTIAGGSEGRVLKAEMIEQSPSGPQKLVGLFSFSSDSKRLVGLVRNADSEASGALYSMYIAEKTGPNLGKCPQIPDWAGNAAKSQISAKLERDGRARLDGINFDFNSDVIRAESKPLLDQVAAMLKEHGDWQVTLEGHTDNIGGAAFNKALSTRRAASVKAYLAGAGVPDARLASSGLGFERPVATNDTQAGRAENRRVEIVRGTK